MSDSSKCCRRRWNFDRLSILFVVELNEKIIAYTDVKNILQTLKTKFFQMFLCFSNKVNFFFK